MALNFPNPSRSFEAKHNRVRFWGYDSAIEITFFIPTDALLKICPEADSAEMGLLEAFDCTLERIHKIAREVYQRSREHSYAYCLAAKDF